MRRRHAKLSASVPTSRQSRLSTLVEGQDIWRAQPDMDAFIDEQFHEITRDRVVETAKQLASEKPHLARPNVSPPPSQQPIESLRPGASPEVKPKPTTWAGALRGR